MPHTLLNIKEVAAYLRVPVSDVEEWARCNEIPCVRHGRDYFFRRSEVENWASHRMLESDPGRVVSFHRAQGHGQTEVHVPILDRLLRPEWIEPALGSRTRAAVIRDMVALAERTGLLNHPEDLLRAVRTREEEAPTALPGGVALLHAGHRVPYVLEDSFLVLGRTSQPIPFGAPDGQGTDLFFLVCCADDRSHLQTLARLCLICLHSNVLATIRSLNSSEEIHAALLEKERYVLSRMKSGRLK